MIADTCQCGGPIKFGIVGGQGPGFFCLSCGLQSQETALTAPQTHSKVRPTQNSAACQKRPQRREEEIQREIIKDLEARGYTVLQTTRRYRPCPKCGHMDRRGDGASKGLADLLIHLAGSVWIAAEVKSLTGDFTSDEQREFARRGWILVWRSVEDEREAMRK